MSLGKRNGSIDNVLLSIVEDTAVTAGSVTDAENVGGQLSPGNSYCLILASAAKLGAAERRCLENSGLTFVLFVSNPKTCS